ncbi:amidohydrolase family protein [Halomonas denitrificans]|nr:amidohydrolase family protein [Halomonas denitrificans]
MNRFSQTLLILALLALAASPARAQDERASNERMTVLTGATVHPVDGDPIADGVVVIRGERIEAIGSEDELADSLDDDRIEFVDLDGLHVYPGFVHPLSQLGLIEIGSVDGTMDQSEMGSINAALRVEVAFNHDSDLLPVSVAGGILTSHTVPVGGLIRGRSAVMRMDGWSWEDMVIEAPAGMHIAFPPGAADNADNDDLQAIDRVLEQARQWHRAQAAFEAGNAPRPPRNAQLEALGPLLDGSLPLFLHADNHAAIEAALDWAGRQAFDNLVLVGGPDLQYLAERLAVDGTPAILTGVYTMPTRRWEPYDQAYVAAARLHEAGVRFAIAGNSGTNARNLPFHAGSAAAFGLPKDAALKSVTQWPAEILGIGDELGTLSVGKRASLIVTDGDPLEPMTSIERVWIDGTEYDLQRNKHLRLFERYRDHIDSTGD